MFKIIISGSKIKSMQFSINDGLTLEGLRNQILSQTDTLLNLFNRINTVKITEEKTKYKMSINKSTLKILKKNFTEESSSFCFVCFQLEKKYSDLFYEYKKLIEKDPTKTQRYLIQFSLECIATQIFELNQKIFSPSN